MIKNATPLELAKDKLKNNLLLFAKICSPNTFVVKTPDFHHEIAELWENEVYDRVNIIAPRGHGKSSLSKFMMLHHLMFGSSKIKFIVIMSRTEGHAIRLLHDLKDIMEYSQPFREVFGYWGKESAKKWAENEVELKDGSLILARGASQQVVGLNHLSQRPTFFVYDDPEDENNTKNIESMETTLKVLMKGVEPGVDPKCGRIWLIGTPQREGCLVMRVKDMPNWTTKHYDAILNEEDKKVLWPEWMSWDKLMEKKASYESINKLSVFYSEYRCQLIGDEDQLFIPADFRYWKGHHYLDGQGESFLKITELGKKVKDGLDWTIEYERLADPIDKPVNTFMGVDPASSVSTSADYSVIMPIAVDDKRNIYVLPYFRKRVKPMDLAQTIISYFKKYKPKKTNIETVGYQEMLRDYLRNEVDIYIPGMEIKNNPRNSKSQRIETLQPFFFSHQMHLQDAMGDLENELMLYPRSSHDDTLDALYYAKKSIYVPSHEKNDSQVNIFRRVMNWATC